MVVSAHLSVVTLFLTYVHIFVHLVYKKLRKFRNKKKKKKSKKMQKKKKKRKKNIGGKLTKKIIFVQTLPFEFWWLVPLGRSHQTEYQTLERCRVLQIFLFFPFRLMRHVKNPKAYTRQSECQENKIST